MDEHVGTNLRALREARGMTQANLAEALEVDQRTVQRIEAGDHRPQKSTLRRMAEVLNVGLDDLRRAPGGDSPDSGTTGTEPATGLPAVPPYDHASEQLVQLTPVRRAMYVCEALRRTEMTRFVRPVDLAEVQAAMADRLFGFLENLTYGFRVASEDAQREAQLELQGDLDDLVATGLVLCVGTAEIVVGPPGGLPGVGPRKLDTLVIGLTTPGCAAMRVAVPLVSDWSGRTVTP